MRSRVSIFSVFVSVLALVVASPALAAPDARALINAGSSFAAERLDGHTLSFDVDNAAGATLTIRGHRGAAMQRDFARGEAISLELVGDAGTTLADGRYRYILRVSGGSERPQIKTGTFFIDNGAAVSRKAVRADLASVRGQLNMIRREKAAAERPGNGEKSGTDGEAIGGGQGLVYGAAYAVPYFRIYGYYSPAPYTPGYFPNPYQRFYHWFGYPYNQASMGHYFYYPFPPYYSYGTFNIGNVGNRREISVFGNFNNYSYFGYLNDFALFGAVYDYAIAYTFYRYPYFGSGNVSHFAYSYDIGYGGYYFQNLVVSPFGVGVGTYYPYADLEVYDYGSYAAMRLNNGTASWAFSNTPAGVFTVNLIGSGGQEFAVRPRFDAGGNTMQVQGSVQGTKFVASSSRDLKTDFTTLDGQEVLAKLAEIPVMSWRYKTDDETDRHFGPVAEDFQAAFQLGDGKTIANIDADGVALAAIQGLHSMLEEKDQEIANLTKRLAALEELLQARSPGDS